MNRKKVYLLYPPISKKERYSSELGESGGAQIPLGIFYLASYLRHNGYEVKLTDAEAEKLKAEQIILQIREYSPQYIGISSTTVAFHRALEIARKIKDNLKNQIIILGGPHITSNPKHAMSFDEFDYGVLHEGEITLVELLNTLNNNTSIDNVKGIAFRNKKNEVMLTPPREYIKDLDTIPIPAYDLIKDIKLYTPPPSNYKTLPVVNIITSRGCPYQCTFCDKNVFGKNFRMHSAKRIVEEIKELKNKFGVKEIAFVDDTFLINRKRIYEIFELLEKENISFYWTCMSRINVVDYEYLKFVKSKGCWHISFGIESGDEEILKKIKKFVTLEKVEQVINWCRKLKIKTKGFFMLGHPGETINTINKTIALACKLKLDDNVTTINTPIPGSQQYAEIDKYGSLDETDWSQFNYWRPVFVPFGLTKDILLKKHREMYRRFYFRPRIIFRYFLSFFSQGGMKRMFSIIKSSRYIFIK